MTERQPSPFQPSTSTVRSPKRFAMEEIVSPGCTVYEAGGASADAMRVGADWSRSIGEDTASAETGVAAIAADRVPSTAAGTPSWI